jgi:hypothetical protein
MREDINVSEGHVASIIRVMNPTTTPMKHSEFSCHCNSARHMKCSTAGSRICMLFDSLGSITAVFTSKDITYNVERNREDDHKR